LKTSWRRTYMFST